MYEDDKKRAGHVCTYFTCTCMNRKKNKNVPFFPLPTESSQMEFSFVSIISFFSLSLLLEHNHLLCTAYVPCLEISSSVQTKKKDN